MTQIPRRIERLFYCLISALLVLAIPAHAAEPNKTVIADTIYRADGAPAHGTILISWPAFSSADGKPVAAGTLSVKIAANGSVNIPLVPTQGALPSGTAYKIVLSLDDGSTSTEYWAVPTLSPTTIAAIRSSQIPATVAMQVVSREYVDAQLASAVRKNGDETISGSKTFSSSPLVPSPGTEAAVANKGYVDVAIAAAAPTPSNVLNITKGGTGTNSFTASRCVRVAADGSSLESAATDCSGADADTVDGKHAADLSDAQSIRGKAVAPMAPGQGDQLAFDTTTNSYRPQAKLYRDIRDFGVVGGWCAHDDAAAVQAAIDGTPDFGELLVPAGLRIGLGSTVQIHFRQGIRIRGLSGVGSSADPGSNAPTFVWCGPAHGKMFDVNRSRGLRFENLAFAATDQSGGSNSADVVFEVDQTLAGSVITTDNEWRNLNVATWAANNDAFAAFRFAASGASNVENQRVLYTTISCANNPGHGTGIYVGPSANVKNVILDNVAASHCAIGFDIHGGSLHARHNLTAFNTLDWRVAGISDPSEIEGCLEEGATQFLQLSVGHPLTVRNCNLDSYFPDATKPQIQWTGPSGAPLVLERVTWDAKAGVQVFDATLGGAPTLVARDVSWPHSNMAALGLPGALGVIRIDGGCCLVDSTGVGVGLAPVIYYSEAPFYYYGLDRAGRIHGLVGVDTNGAVSGTQGAALLGDANTGTFLAGPLDASANPITLLANNDGRASLRLHIVNDATAGLFAGADAPDGGSISAGTKRTAAGWTALTPDGTCIKWYAGQLVFGNKHGATVGSTSWANCPNSWWFDATYMGPDADGGATIGQAASNRPDAVYAKTRVEAPTFSLGAAKPSWSSGAGAPSGSCQSGSLYSRTDGGANSTLYVCVNSGWVAK